MNANGPKHKIMKSALKTEVAMKEPLPIFLSAFAADMLLALRRLAKENEPHPCGGFTTDDMQWKMGMAFTSSTRLHDTLDELEKTGLIRYAGDADDDACGGCYEATEKGMVCVFADLPRPLFTRPEDSAGPVRTGGPSSHPASTTGPSPAPASSPEPTAHPSGMRPGIHDRPTSVFESWLRQHRLAILGRTALLEGRLLQAIRSDRGFRLLLDPESSEWDRLFPLPGESTGSDPCPASSGDSRIPGMGGQAPSQAESVRTEAETRAFDVRVREELRLQFMVIALEDHRLPTPLESGDWRPRRATDAEVAAGFAALHHARDLRPYAAE